MAAKLCDCDHDYVATARIVNCFVAVITRGNNMPQHSVIVREGGEKGF